jgi:hypothetical protein
VIAIYGPPGAWTVPFERSFVGHSINPATGEQTPLKVSAGSSWTATFERGRVLIGMRA